MGLRAELPASSLFVGPVSPARRCQAPCSELRGLMVRPFRPCARGSPPRPSVGSQGSPARLGTSPSVLSAAVSGGSSCCTPAPGGHAVSSSAPSASDAFRVSASSEPFQQTFVDCSDPGFSSLARFEFLLSPLNVRLHLRYERAADVYCLCLHLHVLSQPWQGCVSWQWVFFSFYIFIQYLPWQIT